MVRATTALWCAVAVGFGLVLVAGAEPAADAPVRWLVDLLMWPPGQVPAVLPRPEALAWGVAGGLTIGFGVLMFGLRADPGFEHPGVRRAVLTGLSAWFVTDSAASYWSGGAGNVVANAGFFVLLAVPVWLAGRRGPVAS